MAYGNVGYYNFPNHIKGDTFDGVLFTVLVNDVALDLTDAAVDMDLRLTPTTTIVAKTFSTDNGGITIQTPKTDGKFLINAQIVNIDAADYYYDIEITLSNGMENYWERMFGFVVRQKERE